jgi:alpha-beta hydrolase superfamily lysophospholipase
LKTIQHLVSNGEGWLLSLTQSWEPERLRADLRPVLIVPGYGMNSFIFGYHPRGVSLEGFFADAGFEVWRVDLRAQGGSIRQGGTDDFSLEDLALTDLGVAIRAALERTRTEAERVDVIGASLGGTLLLTHLALVANHQVGAAVAMGSPVRWVKTHPLVRAVFSSPLLVGQLRFRGTRRLAELALPLLARFTPWLLSVYMNPATSDLTAAREMVKTVEDPNRHINREIARWIRERDLRVRGVNVAERLREVKVPLLCVVAHSDGIVPAETARFPYEQIGAKEKGLLVVGDDELRMAHADLFVANAAHEQVFRPMAEWLAGLQQPAARRG